jgi:hypothetical protein
MMKFRAYADAKRYYWCEVRVFATRRQMLRDINAAGFGPTDRDQAGQCSGLTQRRSSGRLTGKFACMWLNAEDLRDRPNELTSHESTHAAMRHARNMRASLDVMEGEEVLCYAQGRIQRDVIAGLYRLKVLTLAPA